MAPRGGLPTAHPDDETQDARHRHDLETRVFGSENPSPADVQELRRLLVRPAAPAPVARAAGVVSADPAPIAARPRAASHGHLGPRLAAHPRLWLAGGALAVLVAAVASGIVAATVTRARIEASVDPVPTTQVIGSPAHATGDGPVAAAEALGAQYFDLPQAPDDRATVQLHGIVSTTTHRVLTQFGPGSRETQVWVAQGIDGSFCLIMTVSQAGGASSCTPMENVVATGVQVDMAVPGGGSVDVTWDLQSGLLVFAPYPAAQLRREQSGDVGATP